MNSGPYHHGPQLHGLPINFQYSDGPDTSEQSTSSHRMLSCDGLPRSQQSSQHFMTTTPASSSSLLGLNYDPVNSMPLAMTQGALWTDQSQQPTHFEDFSTNNYYDHGPDINGETNWLRDPVPRFMPGAYQIYNNTALENYDSSLYLMPDNKPNAQNMQNRSNLNYPSLEEPRDHFARLSISHSPGVLPKIEDEGLVFNSSSYDKLPPFMTTKASSEDGGGNSSREMTATVDLEEQSAEEPYAKLIYRALMSRPNHTMVLQEIYQWFRENTAKGAADGKGWMNSIRHNLSMNAAFKKTERKLPGGDESKKSTEWVLEPFAIKDGVQSTTRYRKGTSSKKFNYGTPTRQSSSRRGGTSTLKGKLSRQRTAKEERDRMSYDPRPSHGNGTVRSASMIDSARRAQFERQTRAHISNDRRQRSPLTPPSGEIASPATYFSSYPKAEQDHLEAFNDPYQFEDCQGVYLGDSPLFSNHGQVSPFHHAAATAAEGSSASAMSSSRF